MLVLWRPHTQSMAFYQEPLTSVSLLANTQEHCCHGDNGGRTVVAWCLERITADSSFAAGLIHVRIGEVEGVLRMSYVRAVDVGENTALRVVGGMNFVVTGMALD